MSDKPTNEQRLIRTVTIYVCPVDGCPNWFGNGDEETPDGDQGWNPDGWSRCSDHNRPMLPVKVEAVRSIPTDHLAGCFYGSFAEAYPDNWHIPHDSGCALDHGAEPIQLEPPGGVCGTIMVGSGGDTWDPSCELPKGHEGTHKSTIATDQHRLVRDTKQEQEKTFDENDP